jgi:hypothetical protein
MIKQLTDYYFWFTQPTAVLIKADKFLAGTFAILVILAIIVWLLVFFIKHEIIKNLVQRIMYLSLTIGLSGLFWFVLRYENTPIFSNRYWAGLILVLGIIWLVFILKFVLFNLSQAIGEYDHEILKKKYLPNSR